MSHRIGKILHVLSVSGQLPNMHDYSRVRGRETNERGKQRNNVTKTKLAKDCPTEFFVKILQLYEL